MSINKIKENIEKFDEKFTLTSYGIEEHREHIHDTFHDDFEVVKDWITKFAIFLLEEQNKELDKMKVNVTKQTGAFKYDWCFESMQEMNENLIKQLSTKQ